jgi:hypothetical protein
MTYALWKAMPFRFLIQVIIGYNMKESVHLVLRSGLYNGKGASSGVGIIHPLSATTSGAVNDAAAARSALLLFFHFFDWKE